MLGLTDIAAINERNIDGRIVYPIRVLLVKRSYDSDDSFLFRLHPPHTIYYTVRYKNAQLVEYGSYTTSPIVQLKPLT